MYKICVFAGTTEGRQLVEFLAGQSATEVTACVATSYGETLLPEAENLTVLAGCQPVGEITRLLADQQFDLVIDATHPYAQSITESVSSACRITATAYLRLSREASAHPDDAVFLNDARGAVEFLAGTEGNILLTTGSKDLPTYTKLNSFTDRVYARVLPAETSLSACRNAGLPASHIIAMQGPFSVEMNLAMLRSVSAHWMVTKDGGAAGGFAEKVSAARQAGARLVVLGRPPQRDGVSPEEVFRYLEEHFGFYRRPHVDILGIGPGNTMSMTRAAQKAVKAADCCIGAERMLASAAPETAHTFTAVSAGEIANLIRKHGEYRRFAVLMSGDTGFFSGTKKLLPLLNFCDVTVLPGISSLSYLCSRINTAYEDVFVTSVHGRRHSIVPDVRRHRRVFVLTGGETGVQPLCDAVTAAGLGSISVTVGENLGYPEERITQGTAVELAEQTFAPLSVVLLENPCPDAVVTQGLPDGLFQRGSGRAGIVPMTKSEVRAVCLSKLQLTAESICWDIGAGTGSVSIEMALQAREGKVFAVERREDALALLRENLAAFDLENLEILPGSAPDACCELPAPSHAFIGGSGGNMREILALLLEKNPCVRIVATAVSLESIAELTRCIQEFYFTDIEVVSIQVARSRPAGAYHLMEGQNPIYIYTLQAGRGKI